MYEALVARVRYHIQKANFMGLKEAESTLLLGEAADVIVELSHENESLAKSMNEAAELLRKRGMPPKWILVTERLPKYGERVLVFGGVTMYVAYYDKNRYGGESWHKLNSKSHYCNPTHWMPLPQPPEEE